MNKAGAPQEKGTSTGEPKRHKRRFGVLLPFVMFAALAGLFFVALNAGDPSNLPSALIGKPVPQFDLPPLNPDGAPQNVTSTALGNGKPAVVHFFASWCGPCREEHPAVMALAKTLRAQDPGIPFYGINYKDDPTAARRFLGGFGDPYSHIGVDRSGRTAINFGVYGVPEIYVVADDGTVAFRHAGPLTEEVVEAKILPLMRKDAKATQTDQQPAERSEPSG
ncbi:MAG: DsbE family thiol:disulfide interchange protein [Methyloceanibacter sp.]|nr:DsbE family thiol:disulfide interchange protein [Methyloceanibacter sp.]